MESMGPVIRKLAIVCRRLGGRLKRISEQEYNNLKDAPTFSDAPFTYWHGVDWKQRIVYVVKGKERINAIIHEMGHVFADARVPDNSDEWDWFGWEVALARSVDAFRQWSALNGDYSVTKDGLPWARVRGKRRQRMIEERIAHAKAIGILSQDEKPLVHPDRRNNTLC